MYGLYKHLMSSLKALGVGLSIGKVFPLLQVWLVYSDVCIVIDVVSVVVGKP